MSGGSDFSWNRTRYKRFVTLLVVRVGQVVKIYVFTVQHLSICPNHGPSCCNAFTEKKFTRLAKEPMSTIVNEKFNSLRSRFFDFLRKFESKFLILIVLFVLILLLSLFLYILLLFFVQYSYFK